MAQEEALFSDDDEALIILRPGRHDQGARLDRYVADQVPDLSRGGVQSLIEAGRVLVDDRPRKAKFRITPGEVISVAIPPTAPDEITPDAIPLDVVFEDADVIVVNKPAGLVVHPAPGHPRGTLANALVAHVPGIAVGGSSRPGIVHRLDRDTSGLIVAAKTDRGRMSLVSQFEQRSVQKTYLALVAGTIDEHEATIDAPIGRDAKNRQRMAVVRSGRPALTHFRVLERFSHATLLEVTIETGRTHQIRVHLAFVGHPVIGDSLYGVPRRGLPESGRQFLHAGGLAFRLPDGSSKRFLAPMPDDLELVLATVRADEASEA